MQTWVLRNSFNLMEPRNKATQTWRGTKEVWNWSGSDFKGQVTMTKSTKRTTAECFEEIFGDRQWGLQEDTGSLQSAPAEELAAVDGGRQRRSAGTNWDWRSLLGAGSGTVTRALPHKRSDKMSCQRPAAHVTRRTREPGPPAAPALSPFYSWSQKFFGQPYHEKGFHPSGIKCLSK